MRYLLDTDTLVFALRGHPTVLQRFRAEERAQLATSGICIGELFYGAYKSGNLGSKLPPVIEMADYLNILPLTHGIMDRFGRIKANLEKQGQRLDDADLGIAATAIEHNLILVSHNRKHFGRIPDLTLEDWVT